MLPPYNFFEVRSEIKINKKTSGVTNLSSEVQK